MAVTSIWAVKRSVKEILAYAVNPEKTAMPEELRKVISYASDGDKTERRYLVSGINCLPETACERMTATKQHYGKMDGIVAYHAYQSFSPGEITPKQCHELGVELARRMWGDRFEVLIATHTNCDHMHNHFVINSVSFADGKKLRCGKYYYKELRKVSDQICREIGFSVIQNPPEKSQPRAAWQAQKSGKLTHRQMLMMDIEDALSDCMTIIDLRIVMEARGYQIVRNNDYAHISIIAEGWKRPVRLDSLGKAYTPDAIKARLMRQFENGYHRLYYPDRAPFYELREEMKRLERLSMMDLIFAIFMELLGVKTPYSKPELTPKPLSPVMRAERIHAARSMELFNFMNRKNIHSEEDVNAYIEKAEAEMEALEKERRDVDNYRRRHKDETGVKEQTTAARRALTDRIKPIRHDLSLARQTMTQYRKALDLLKLEMQTEERVVPKVVQRITRQPITKKREDYER